MEDKITGRNILELWANKYAEVTRWLTKIQKKEQGAINLYRFCEWSRKTPPELLALKEKDATVSPQPNLVEKLLDDFCGETVKGFTNAEKFNISIAVKSFHKWSYRALERACGNVSLEKVKPYNPLSKELLRRLWNHTFNPRDRAIIPFVTCTAIAKETLSNLPWSNLEPDWETKDLPCITIESKLLKGHGHGRYKDVRQITFLTPEAKRELLVYREWIEEHLGRKVTPQDHIWLTTVKPYKPLTYKMLGNGIDHLSREAKVKFSLHDGRRWVNTALEQVGISQNWARKIRGRKVKGEEAPYSQPQIEQLRAKFREAVPLLEFTSDRPTIDLEQKAREAAKAEFEKILSPEQQALFEDFKIAYKVRSKSKVTKQELARKAEWLKKEQECSDGQHCQKIVAEAELGNFLAQGWHVVTALPSGKIVVDR